MTTLGIIRETKTPPDRRVPLNPEQCRRLLETHEGLHIVVQPSPIRCFSDAEYAEQGIELSDDLTDCDVLMGVKEVEPYALVPDRTYFFFSHTAKEQPYNRGLLQEVVHRRIRLVDYEYLTRNGERVVAFGRWAGVVGAYNGLRALGRKTGAFELKPAHRCFDLAELRGELHQADLPPTRIAVTGGGRVAGGALEILEEAGVRQIEPDAFLAEEPGRVVYTRLDPWHYTRRRDGDAFDFGHFVAHPDAYENNLLPYAARAEVLVACHFWDPRAPQMLTREDFAGGRLPLSVIADISCDIGEPIASTIRPSTIAEPFFGYDPASGREAGAFEPGVITVMAVDNLPGELPRDASSDFGEALIARVIPEILSTGRSAMLQRASITLHGELGPDYGYLEGYLAGTG